MKKITVKKLTNDSFREYGTFANMVNPEAPKLGSAPVEFFRDMVQLELGVSKTASFSTCRVLKRDRRITELEYHNYTGEAALPMDGDILLALAPATAVGDIPEDRVEVFYIPKGTLAVIRPGVWHCAAFAEGSECVNVLIGLPERVYANDCHVHKLAGEITVE